MPVHPIDSTPYHLNLFTDFPYMLLASCTYA